MLQKAQILQECNVFQIPGLRFFNSSPKFARVPQEGGLVQGWESVFLDNALYMIPIIYNRIHNSLINRLLTVNGSWLKAHASRLVAHG